MLALDLFFMGPCPRGESLLRLWVPVSWFEASLISSLSSRTVWRRGSTTAQQSPRNHTFVSTFPRSGLASILR